MENLRQTRYNGSGYEENMPRIRIMVKTQLISTELPFLFPSNEVVELDRSNENQNVNLTI